jgi:hypothetical protein
MDTYANVTQVRGAHNPNLAPKAHVHIYDMNLYE